MQKVLLVDEHRIFTDGLRMLLEYMTDLHVIGALQSGRDVMPFIQKHLPDIVVLDLDMADDSGLEIGKKVKHHYPHVKLLTLSMLKNPYSHGTVMGADGFCSKTKGIQELFSMIEKLSGRGSCWPAGSRKSFLLEATDAKDFKLSDREREVIRLICGGLTTAAIAQQLFRSPRTIETHRKNIYRKLKVHSNIDLMAYAKNLRIV